MAQEKGMAWHGGAGVATVSGLDDLAKPLHGELPLPHLQQGADDGSHHITQEAIGLDGENQQLTLLFPTRLQYTAVVGFYPRV